jgi:anti-sigma B factor antagonist
MFQYRSRGHSRTDTMQQILEPEDFSIQENAEGDRCTLVLKGELDLASTPALEAAVARLCADGASELVLDLHGLSFIDSTGLRTILSSMSLCEEHLCNFWLIPGQRAIQRLFELAGLLERLPFREPEPRPSETGA